MKLFKNAAIALLATLAFSTSAFAADKIGFVNVQAVFAQLPQAKATQEAIKAEFAEQVAEVQKLQSDAKYNYDKLQREGATMSTEQQDELKKQILNIQKELEAKGKPLQANMQRRSVEERNKILGLIQQTVDAVAAEGKFQLILNSEAVAYAEIGTELDVSKKVLERVSKIK